MSVGEGQQQELVGRDGLTSWLVQRWRRARGGSAEVVVLVGPGGIGKSSLLSWLGRRAADVDGGQVIARSGHHQRSTPLSTLRGLLADLDTGESTTLADDRADPSTRGQQLLDSLTARAGRGPLLVMVDDLHEVDPSSRAALSLAVRRLQGMPILVLLASRPGAVAQTFGEGLTVRQVPPLDDESGLALLTGRAGPDVADWVVARVLRAAAGNPLVLTRLLSKLTPDQLRGRVSLPDPLPMDGDLRSVFDALIDDLPQAPRRLLELIAVAAQPRWDPLAEVMGADAEDALALLETRRLVTIGADGVHPEHPLLGSAVRDRLTPAQVRELHRDLAETASVTDEERLLHRAHGTLGSDELLAKDLLDHAEDLLSFGALEEAADVLELAVRLTPLGGERLERQLRAAQAYAVAGAADRARPLFTAVRDDATSAELGRDAVVGLALLEALHGDPLGALQRLRVVASEETRPEARGQLHAQSSIPLGMLGLVRDIVEASEQAVADSPAGSVVGQVATVTLAHAREAMEEGTAAPLLDETLPTLDLQAAALLEPMFGLHVGRSLAMSEDYDTASQTLAALLSTQRGDAALAMSEGALGEVHYRSCRWDAAQAASSEAIALSFSIGQRAFATFWLATRGRIRGGWGDLEGARRDLELGLAIADDLSLLGARYFLAASLGMSLLGAGKLDEAASTLEQNQFFEMAGGVLAPNLARWRPDLIEVYLALGRRSDAESVNAHLQEVAASAGASRWTRGVAARCAGLLAREPDGAVEALEESIAIHDPILDRFDVGRTELALADRLIEGGEERRAREVLDWARAHLEAVSAKPWLDRHRALVARLDVGSEPSLSELLSPSQMKVLELVSTGMTNQQVASEMGLSPKTVANHLARMFKRLGVSSRTEAANRFITDRRRT